jgi:CRISP-associated protein Cas1
MAGGNRLLVKVTRESLPQVRDKYPFLYLERGRLEIDDSSIKWVDASGEIIPLPASTISCLLLGPGTSVTHEAIKVAASCNCSICWVGEDSLLFYAAGIAPTADSRNMRRQIELSADPDKAVEVARKLYAKRFPTAELKGKTLKEMMGMEGFRVRDLYEKKASEYRIDWGGRNFTPGKFL